MWRAWVPFQISRWSSASRRRVPMTRSQWAFIRGARGAVLTTSMSSAVKTVSNGLVYFASRSRIRKRSEVTRTPNSAARLLACWTVQDAVG